MQPPLRLLRTKLSEIVICKLGYIHHPGSIINYIIYLHHTVTVDIYYMPGMKYKLVICRNVSSSRQIVLVDGLHNGSPTECGISVVNICSLYR